MSSINKNKNSTKLIMEDIFNNKFILPNRYSHYTNDTITITNEIRKNIIDSINKTNINNITLLLSGGLESTLLYFILKDSDIEFSTILIAPSNNYNSNSTAFLGMRNLRDIDKNIKIIIVDDQFISDSATYCKSITYNKNLDYIYDLTFWDILLKKYINNDGLLISGGFLREIIDSIPNKENYSSYSELDSKFNNRLKKSFNKLENELINLDKLNSPNDIKIIFPFHSPNIIKNIGKLDTETLHNDIMIDIVNNIITDDNIKIPLHKEKPGNTINVSGSILAKVKNNINEKLNIKKPTLDSDEIIELLWLNRFEQKIWN